MLPQPSSGSRVPPRPPRGGRRAQPTAVLSPTSSSQSAGGHSFWGQPSCLEAARVSPSADSRVVFLGTPRTSWFTQLFP